MPWKNNIVFYLAAIIALFVPVAALSTTTANRFYDVRNDAKQLFNKFISRFGRKYSNHIEYENRFQIFQQTLRTINERNMKAKDVLHGITRFADKTSEEMGSTTMVKSFLQGASKINAMPYVPPPPGNCSKNWVVDNSEYTIRNQLYCGNCWSYAIAESIRDNFIIQYGKDPGRLSSQYLTDCAKSGWTCNNNQTIKNGCCGGNPFKAFNNIMRNGIPTTGAYGGEKYYSKFLANVSESAVDPDKLYKCKTSVSRVIKTITPPQIIAGAGFLNMTDERIDLLEHIRDVNGTIAAAHYACIHFGIYCPVPGTHLLRSPEPLILNEICNVGPIVVGICGSALGSYISGIITANTCCTDLSHSVQLVGFDQEKQAYIVRNSWGGVGSGNTNFGVSPFPPYEPYHQLPDGNWTKGGYFLLKYGENTCGIGTAGIKMPKLARYDMYIKK